MKPFPWGNNLIEVECLLSLCYVHIQHGYDWNNESCYGVCTVLFLFLYLFSGMTGKYSECQRKVKDIISAEINSLELSTKNVCSIYFTSL